MGTAVRLTTRRQSLLCLSHPSITMQKTLLLVLLVAFVASTSAFHFGLGGIGYGLGYGYGMPYGYGIGGYGLGGFGYGLGGYGLGVGGYGLGYGFGGYPMFGKGY